MRNKEEAYRHEHCGLQFLLALERGDATELAALWEEAENDPVLASLFEELLKEDDEPQKATSTSEASTTSSQDPLLQPSHVAKRPALPPIPLVIVRHNLPTADEQTTHTRTNHSEDPRGYAGVIEKLH